MTGNDLQQDYTHLSETEQSALTAAVGSILAALQPDDIEGRPFQVCRVYWGSHGCDRPRGHEGPCVCLSCLYDEHGQPEWDGYVGMPLYYGPDTVFYGEDVRARGLPIE